MRPLFRRLCSCTIVAIGAASIVATCPALGQADSYTDRAALVRDIARQAEADYPGLTTEPGFKLVLKAVESIDRARFVPIGQRPNAYKDKPLPIGFDQTISDPYVVTKMTALVGVKAGSNVLEIGTGSGYQAAVLSRVGARVHSIEIVPQLARSAAQRLRRYRFTGVTIKTGDGFVGWPEYAPYDAVIVTAGSSQVPAPLLEQLKIGGRLVMPIGANTPVEQLLVFTKRADGKLDRCSLGPAMFVPFTGAGQRPETPGLYDRSIPLCRKGQTARWSGQPIGP